MSARQGFLPDIKEIRRRARQHLSEGAVTQNYGGKVEDAIALLNHAVATEIVCILRYKFHAVCATGLASEAVKEEFAQHAKELANLIERAMILSKGRTPDVPLSELKQRRPRADQNDGATTLEAVERMHILRVLGETNWMLGGARGATARLGMKRTTLQSLM